MDRLTSTIKLPEDGVFRTYTAQQLEEIKSADKVSPKEIYRLLQAYEDTGLSPADVVILKAKYEDSYIEHLGKLSDLHDKQVSALFIKNQRLKKLLNEIEDILKGA